MNCAFLPCDQADECALVGVFDEVLGRVARCAQERGFVQPVVRIIEHPLEAEGLKRDARALVGTEARPVRDPAKMARKRKVRL